MEKFTYTKFFCLVFFSIQISSCHLGMFSYDYVEINAEQNKNIELMPLVMELENLGFSKDYTFQPKEDLKMERYFRDSLLDKYGQGIDFQIVICNKSKSRIGLLLTHLVGAEAGTVLKAIRVWAEKQNLSVSIHEKEYRPCSSKK